MAVIGIGTTSRASLADVLAVIAAAKEEVARRVAGTARSRLPAGCELQAYTERTTPVPLPMGEGTMLQPLCRRPLSHGERDRVRGDSPGSVHNIAALAALDRPALNGILQEAARWAGLGLILLPLDELRTAAHLCATHSEHSMKRHGIPSVADVAARLAPFYGAECPAAVVFRASWPDERIVRGTLADIAEAVVREPIERTAIIFVGEVLGEDEFRESALYSVDYQRRFRGRMP